MAMAGLDPSALPGRSLVAQMEADAPAAHTGKSAVVCESFDHAMIRTDSHKLVTGKPPGWWQGEQRNVWELYDLVKDEDETLNVVDHPDIRKQLVDELTALQS